MTKMNKIEKFAEVIAFVEGKEVTTMTVKEMTEFLAHEVELLEKKATTKRVNKNAESNEIFKTLIKEVLSNATKPMTVSEIQKQNEELGTLSNQRVSSILKTLKESNEVINTKEGKKSVFTLA